MQRVIRLRLLSSMALEVKIGPQRKTFRAAKLLRHPIIGSFHTATVRPDVKLFFLLPRFFSCDFHFLCSDSLTVGFIRRIFMNKTEVLLSRGV